MKKNRKKFCGGELFKGVENYTDTVLLMISPFNNTQDPTWQIAPIIHCGFIVRENVFLIFYSSRFCTSFFSDTQHSSHRSDEMHNFRCVATQQNIKAVTSCATINTSMIHYRFTAYKMNLVVCMFMYMGHLMPAWMIDYCFSSNCNPFFTFPHR